MIFNSLIKGGGGADLNIAYGDTAPNDTSKLWIKANKPENIYFPSSAEVGASLKTNDILIVRGGIKKFDILKVPTKLDISVKNAYIGVNDVPELVDAYLYDETKFGWVNINTGEVLLDDIYQSASTLTIENAMATQSGMEVIIE